MKNGLLALALVLGSFTSFQALACGDKNCACHKAGEEKSCGEEGKTCGAEHGHAKGEKCNCGAKNKVKK